MIIVRYIFATLLASLNGTWPDLERITALKKPINRACLTLVIGLSVFTSGCIVFDSSADVEMEDPVIEADLASNQWDTLFARPGVVPVLPPGEEVVYLTRPRLKINAAQQLQGGVCEHFATQHNIRFTTVFAKIMADTADARNKQHPGGHVFR